MRAPGSVPCVWAQLLTQWAVSAVARGVLRPRHLWQDGHFLAGTCLGTTHSWTSGAAGCSGSQVVLLGAWPPGRVLVSDPRPNTPAVSSWPSCPSWSGPGLSICPHRRGVNTHTDGGQSHPSSPCSWDLLRGRNPGGGNGGRGLSWLTSALKSSSGAHSPPAPSPAQVSLAWRKQLVGAGSWGTVLCAPPLLKSQGTLHQLLAPDRPLAALGLASGEGQRVYPGLKGPREVRPKPPFCPGEEGGGRGHPCGPQAPPAAHLIPGGTLGLRAHGWLAGPACPGPELQAQGSPARAPQPAVPALSESNVGQSPMGPALPEGRTSCLRAPCCLAGCPRTGGLASTQRDRKLPAGRAPAGHTSEAPQSGLVLPPPFGCELQGL